MKQSAADNDILLKGAWFGLLRELVAAIPCSTVETLVLGQARFVVGKRLQRARERGESEAAAALEHFNEVMNEVVEVEPTPAEIKSAAQLEKAAQAAGLALDTGESLLTALVIHRGLSRLATGDKRAILALERLASSSGENLGGIHGKVLCLEQMFLRLLDTCDPAKIGAAVRRKPKVDKALTACFGNSHQQDWVVGLNSYIGALRRGAPTVLES